MDKIIDTRINTLKAVLPGDQQKHVEEALKAANGDWAKASADLKDKLSPKALVKANLAHSLADWSGDNVAVVKAFAEKPGIKSLRDVALNYDADALTKLVQPGDVPETAVGATPEEKAKNFAATLNTRLFTSETSAVLQRMVKNTAIPIADASVRDGVTNFLANQPDFNIRTTSIYAAMKQPDAFKGIADEQKSGVVEQLRKLACVQAISPAPEAVPVLMKANLTTAFSVAEMPESTFMGAYRKDLGEETARQVYTLAVNNRMRNEHALITMREAVRGTGMAAVDGAETTATRMYKMQKTVDENAAPLNLAELFGSMDFCECGECNSVYSPASYFVELLNFLRNNNLDPKDPNTDLKSISGTPLEKLFRRRPDLGCLELTCQNAFTVLPYVDLVNEVMESFVVHLGEYHADANDPKQAKLEAFNVEADTTSGELLSEPQNVNYDAYCILKNAVYPFTLPYHQPIDAQRIFLDYLGTSRYELLDRFRSAHEPSGNGSSTPADVTAADLNELTELHKIVLDRAVDAEFLGLTQEEYIILTKEAFWPKRYFEISNKATYTDSEWEQNIGVKDPWVYYGYTTEAAMLDANDDEQAGRKGLSFVKRQFLPRTGIQYTDLVELLKTRCINPNYPQGQALTILESIRFSYRFLQTLVESGSTDPKVRFAKLIEFLESTQSLMPLVDALMHPDPCKPKKIEGCDAKQDMRHWVYCWFERIGKMIVLESGEGPRLSIAGRIYTQDKPPAFIGTLRSDGTIVNESGAIIGTVDMKVQAVGPDGKPFVEKYGNAMLQIQNEEGTTIGFINAYGIWGLQERRVKWLPAQDTCNLEKVRLQHLDGSAVTREEFDLMQRFIRLWRKMGWSIDETDKALSGLTSTAAADKGTPPSGASSAVGFSSFRDDCLCTDSGEACCGDVGTAGSHCSITPDFLHQLVAVRKVLDLTGLPLIKLLTFWADISTVGDKSLYAKLFLTHNMLGIDKVFEADRNGNYLTQGAKITEHISVLMAALKLKADDIAAIVAFRQLPDALTLHNVTILYRHGLFAKVLHVKASDLADVAALFGEPFRDAQGTFDLLETWGKMEDAGFTFRQLNYLIQGHDDPKRPLAPAKKTVLKISKTLYDGLNAIDRDHPDVQKADDADSELVRSKAALLYDQQAVEAILGLLEGTTGYTTNAPVNETITVPADLSGKLTYSDQKDANPPSATIQVTGILTDNERTKAKALSASPEWSAAIDRVGKQAFHLFSDLLTGIFPNVNEATSKLLAGDVIVPADQLDPAQPDPNTAPLKRFYFLQSYLPFLRRRLARRFIIDTMSAASGLPGDVTDVLLSQALVAGTPPEPAASALEKVKQRPAGSSGGWNGYLIVPAEGAFTFITISDTKPAPLTIDNQAIEFPNQQDDPSNVWSTDPVILKSGNLYQLGLTDRSTDQLSWKTAASPKAAIPSSALLPDYSAKGTEEVFAKLFKAAILVNGFTLTADEAAYWQSHASDFDSFDFNSVALTQWKRMQAYADLRGSLPKVESTLLDLFKWASSPNDPAKLSDKISAITGWEKASIDSLLAADHFDLGDPAVFRNEKNLVTMKKALATADKIGTDIGRLFAWARPGSKFRECHQIAEDIRMAVRGRFDQEDWEQVVKPLSDRLREDQKQALISYLLVQQDLIDWGAIDADSLFEFFLIDVQMGACMQTSRIKQAISSVQLFIQRCLMGLEDRKDGSGNQIGVPGDAIDRDRWEWMQKYRVWEANRKVFLYPENWIQPELRDDKSPFYKELESELLQKDINTQTVEDALKSYLFKVDEVANLRVVGLFLDTVGSKLHVFARTRNAPYFFYYRYFHTNEKNWYAWEKVQVDIPNYDVEDNGYTWENGAYLIPVVWNGRLLVFFPQFMKKTVANAQMSNKTFQEIGNNNKPSNSKPTEFWEIKMAWSERRNNKWMQKQVSTDAVYESQAASQLPTVSSYKFVPRLLESPDRKVVIDVYRSDIAITETGPTGILVDDSAIGAFHFTGSHLYKGAAVVASTSAHLPQDYRIYVPDFHYINADIHSLQAIDTADPAYYTTEPYFTDETKQVRLHENSIVRYFSHPFVHDLLGKLTSGNLSDLFAYYAEGTFDADCAYGADDNAKYHELKRPYSLYNWETAFHAPMQLADRLMKSQQFDKALSVCHYVFNPFASGTDEKRFWQFPPFKEIDAKNELENLFMSLKPGKSDDKINEWRQKPFQPHVVARSRPSAYMKWTVMKYIEILIAYGDYYFRQNTLETIPLAIQCYVLAAHIYGPRGQKIPRRGKVQAQTYKALLDRWDAFGNAMVEMELAFPFSTQTPLPIGISNGVIGLANVFGFATTLYFCIPDNPQLRALRDTIDDRLFKIRHCQDIDGVFRQLPLFEPPIEPGLLVQAAAQGVSISSVLNDMNSPMPNYRFYYLLQKAIELCSELKALGNAFLSAKEKKDAEHLSNMRATHETSIHNLVMEVRKQQLEEANRSLDALEQNRKGPVYRLQHYLKLIGEDLSKVPDAAGDFSELPNQIEQPSDESGLKLIRYEKEEMDKAARAADGQVDIGRIESIASILHAIPTIGAFATPIGVGANLTIGGSNFGSAMQGIARWMQTDNNKLSFEGTSAGRKGGFLRQLQDRVQQANVAGYEIKNIDKQILTQQIRIAIANQEITNQQKQIDNAQEVEEYLRNKYTNEELYVWMEGSVRTLYYQAYTMAYELAKKAEKAYRFERGLDTSNFIQPGYWDQGRDGLLSGERLYLGLKQLEAAYQEKRGYDFEITKPVSLRQVDPMSLIHLKETGACEFALPEVIFDMDHPGHYLRRIKSIALTVPCVVGPYTSLNCTLRLLEHKFRMSAITKDKGDYPEKTDETDDRFSTVNVPITSIAVSTGQNDSGVFELNFRDERYIPFEGAGAISKWRIELPSEFRQFDYDTISDVIMHVRYTALDGGDKLKAVAGGSIQDYIKGAVDLSQQEGLFAVFDLEHDFPNEWYKANNPPAGAQERSLTLNNLNDKLPVFTKGRAASKIQATDVYLFAPGASLDALRGKMQLAQADNSQPFAADGPSVGTTMKSVVLHDLGYPMDTWQLEIQNINTKLEKAWLLIRYTLT